MISLRRILLVTAALGILGAVVFVGMATSIGAIGRSACHVTVEEARDAMVSNAVLPDDGTDYCIHSNSRGTSAHVLIDEYLVLAWLESHHIAPDDLPYGCGIGKICDHDGWFVSNGWIAEFDDNQTNVVVVYDRDKHIASITCK